jgi:dihydroneopterin aldolase
MSATPLIAVTGIRTYARHGVFEHEKKQDQLFVTDLFITLARPVTSDDLSTTVDYAQAVKVVAEVLATPPVDLIETLAKHIAQKVLDLPNAAAVRVVLHKPTVQLVRPIADVSVTVELSK